MANTAPQFHNLDGYDADGGATYMLGGAAIHIDTDASVLDAELGPVWTNARLTIQRYHDVDTNDLFGLEFAKGSGVVLDGDSGALQFDFGDGLATFGIVTFGAGTLTVDFKADAGAEAYSWLVDEVLHALTYANGSADTSVAGTPVTISYALEDMPGQPESMVGYGEATVSVLRPGNTLDFSSAGDLTFDLDHNPETKGEHAQSVGLAFQDFEGTDDLRVSSTYFPFGEGEGFLSGTITSLTGFDFSKITSAIGTDGSDFFYAIGSTRSLHLSGGYGSDSFSVFGNAAGVQIDGGSHKIDETGSQEFHDAVEYAGNAGISLDLAVTDGEGFALASRTQADKTAALDKLKDIEIVRATDGVDTIKGNDGFNAFIGFGGDDILEGRGGNDWLQGWTGNDTLDGGTGYDTASFRTSYAVADELGIKVDLNAKDKDGAVLVTVYQKDGPDTDKLYSIENIEGTFGDDDITGDAGDNIIAAYDGKNIIDAGDGNDLVYLIEKDTASTQIRLGKGNDFVVDQTTYLTKNVDTLILKGTRTDYDVWDASAGNGTSGLVLIQEQNYSYAGKFLGIQGRKDTAAADEGTDIVGGVERFLFLGADGVQGTTDDEVHSAETLLAPTNSAPTADAVTAKGGEHDPFIEVLLTASDADAGDKIDTYRLASLPSLGTLFLSSDFKAGSEAAAGVDYAADASGTLKLYFRPETEVGGSTKFAFSASDGETSSSDATATVTVVGVNDDPRVSIPIADQTASENRSFKFTLPEHTLVDPEGESLTYRARLPNMDPLPEWLSFDAATRTFTGTPTTADIGTIEVRVDATDSGDLKGFDLFTIDVNATNDGDATATLGGAVKVGSELAVTFNNDDPDGVASNITAQWQRDTGKGFEDIAGAAGKYYTLTAADAGAAVRAVVSYTDAQGFAGTAATTASTKVNTIPDARDDAPAASNEDVVRTFSAASLLANDYDPDIGDHLTIRSVASVSGGSVALNGDGDVVFTSAADYAGPASFTYTVQDGLGDTDTATVSFTLDPVDDGAGSAVVTGIAEVGETLSAALTAGLPDGGVQTILGYQWQRDTGTGFADIAGATSNAYTLTLGDANARVRARVTYRDGQGFTNTADSGASNLVGGDGFTTPTATPDANQALAIVESGVNNIANQYTLGDSVLDNDHDPDNGDSLHVSGVAAGTVSGPVAGSVGRAVMGTYGVLRMGADGTWTYILDNTDADTQALKGGQTVDDVFSYTAMDTTGRTASSTLTVHVQGDDDAPLVSVIPVQTGDEDEPLTIDVLAHARDPEGGTVTIVGTPVASHGSVVISGGQLVYTPAAGYNGTDTIVFTVQDETGLSITRTVPVAITPVNDAPIATALYAKGAEDTPIALTLTASDPDTGDRIETFRIEDKPDHGTLYLDAAMKKEMSAGIDYATAKDGKLAVYFRPDDDFAGAASFMFRAGDGELLSDPAKMTVTVTPVNDAPRADDKQVFATLEDALLTSKLAAVDVDGDNLTFALYQKGRGAILAQHGKVVLEKDGDFTYTPDKDFFGRDTFTYTVKDPSGATITRTAVVDVASVNDAPTFRLPNKGVTTVNEDTAGLLEITGFGFAISPGPANEANQTTQRFIVANSNPGLFSGGLVFDDFGYSGPGGVRHDPTGNLQFRLAPNAFGTATLTVRAQDSGGVANGGVDFTDQTYTIIVRNVNDTPEGQVTIADTTPTEGDALTATASIRDRDGILGSLAYQWQRLVGSTWVNIVGGAGILTGGVGADNGSNPGGTVNIPEYSVPPLLIGEELVHQSLRLQVSYTDGGGTVERVYSPATDPVRWFGIAGTPGVDIMQGTGGDDVFLGSASGDTINGGGGSDTVNYIDSPRTLVSPSLLPFDISGWTTTGVFVTLEWLGIQAGMGIGGDAGGDRLSGIEDVIGSRHDDVISGNADANVLQGRDGNDWLRGLANNDKLGGGIGNDRLEGGDGEDTLYGDDGNDTLIGGLHSDTLYGGAGTDTLYAGSDIGVPDLFSNTLYGGDGADRIFGDIGNDYLYGDAGADRIDGGAGNDRIEGGDDNDVLIGGLGSDFISGGAGNDTIWGAAEGLAGLPDVPVLGNNELYGGEGNDTIYGNAGNDVIAGGAGYDRLTGGLANDRFVFDDGDSIGGDLILDFTRTLFERDVIDLSRIDANATLAGDQDFVFQTDRALAQATAGSVYVDGGRFVLGITTDAQFAYLNLDSDAQWEMTIEIRPAVPTGKLTATDFTL